MESSINARPSISFLFRSSYSILINRNRYRRNVHDQHIWWADDLHKVRWHLLQFAEIPSVYTAPAKVEYDYDGFEKWRTDQCSDHGRYKGDADVEAKYFREFEVRLEREKIENVILNVLSLLISRGMRNELGFHWMLWAVVHIQCLALHWKIRRQISRKVYTSFSFSKPFRFLCIFLNSHLFSIENPLISVLLTCGKLVTIKLLALFGPGHIARRFELPTEVKTSTNPHDLSTFHELAASVE